MFIPIFMTAINWFKSYSGRHTDSHMHTHYYMTAISPFLFTNKASRLKWLVNGGRLYACHGVNLSFH